MGIERIEQSRLISCGFWIDAEQRQDSHEHRNPERFIVRREAHAVLLGVSGFGPEELSAI